MSMKAITVHRFEPSRTASWNAFLDEACNATFLFHRAYMEYHSDRFLDHSLMVYEGTKLVALLPASLASDGILVSHGGLTYGGLVHQPGLGLRSLIRLVRALLQYLQEHGISILVYKSLPSFYWSRHSQDMDYVLFLLDAKLLRRDSAITLDLREPRHLSQRRLREIRKAEGAAVLIAQDSDFAPFWQQVLVPNLQLRFGVKPVHSVEEISLLASRFPNHIKQYSAYQDGALLAGMTIYETETVAHAQYIAATPTGRELGALDLLVNHLVNQVYPDKRYFDLGICNERDGRHLNTGLLEWKEGFRGQCFCHDFHELDTRRHPVLDAFG